MTKHKFKSIDGAVRRIRQLENQVTDTTQTPTELDAIRARWRGEVIRPEQYGWTEIRNGVWTHPEIFGGKLECDYPHVQLVQDSADLGTLLELLDERNEENQRLYNNLQGFAEVSLIESSLEDFLETMDWSADISDDTKTLVLGNLRGFTSHLRAEKKNFDKSLDETMQFTENLIVKSFQSEIESLRRELAEAREKVLEEAAQRCEARRESFLSNNSNRKNVMAAEANEADKCARSIRSLKQPNQKDL